QNTGVDAATPVLPDNAVDSTIEDRIPIVTQSTEPALAQPSVSEDAGPVSGNLEIAFSGDCWVQVRDATGHQLTSSLKRAGDTLDVSGETPVNVVIGALAVFAIFAVILAVWAYKIMREDEGDGDNN
ncbi:hypothetical protein LCGC14_1710820, partial [marine sediment metagenome]